MESNDCIPGTPVTYWPIRNEDGTFEGTPFPSTIRFGAYEAYGNWVCFIIGKAGYVLCSHLVKRDQ